MKTASDASQSRAPTDDKRIYRVSICGLLSFTTCCVSFLLWQIAWFIVYKPGERPRYFDFWEAFNLLCYYGGVYTMLLTFLMRVHYAFRHSFLKFPMWLMRCLYLELILIAVTIITAIILFASGDADIRRHYVVPIIAIGIVEVVSFDAILLYILIRKLLRIFVMRGNINRSELSKEEETDDIVQLDTLEATTKYSTLILIGVVSTLIAAAMIAIDYSLTAVYFPNVGFIAVDTLINATALALMFTVFDAKYDKYCTKYHSCFQQCCIHIAYNGEAKGQKTYTKEQFTSLVLADFGSPNESEK